MKTMIAVALVLASLFSLPAWSETSGDRNSTTILSPDARGHFITTGWINGISVRMIVDTGATSVSMSEGQAWQIGLPYHSGRRVKVSTPAGVFTGYLVKLDKVKVGNITLNQVEGLVHETVIGAEPQHIVLLGMSFLNRVKMKREGADLILTKKK